MSPPTLASLTPCLMPARILEGMLLASPGEVLERFTSAKSVLAVFGRSQRLTDLPPFAYLHDWKTDDGRSYADLIGAGSPGPELPVTAIGESDVLWLGHDNPYKQRGSWESIAVHEIAHSVLNLGLGPAGLAAVRSVFAESSARRADEVAASSPYGWYNHDEYFAVMSSCWLGSKGRVDTSLGLLTRSDVEAQEGAMADVLARRAYGRGSWTYAGDPSLPQATRPASYGLALAAGADGQHMEPLRHATVQISPAEMRAAAARRRPGDVWQRPADS